MPSFDAKKDLAYSTVLTPPSPAISGLSLVLAAGGGALMPAAPFYATVGAAGAALSPTNAEVVRVTGVATDTPTIVRAQLGTSARTILAGDQFFAGIYAVHVTALEAAISNHASVTLTLEDDYQRFTIADATVSATSLINGDLIRGAVAEVDDPGWFYDHNIVNRKAGSFDIVVKATMWGEDAADSIAALGAPGESLTFAYVVI